ncbi:unnamed protein product [Vitrella brassicaformis CCMP3155]|uniref:protein-ribulosamine 3-kinase n=2 Tax=Vitrella brassicaformis TaxID=1169539 RepID=A0A0G4FFG3_VITBC|nr:unnamed protein product [Vitrella brassicaformis CCMP3155]|eukprot:CEM11907.1 unnamed protein product [Vitrella brassicaformis CCMP3155]
MTAPPADDSSADRPRQLFDDVRIPALLRDPVIEKIEEIGGGKVTEVKEVTPGPGLFNRHFLYTATGGTFLCKQNERNTTANFRCEMESLNALRNTRTLRVPESFAVGHLPLGGAFLLMEHIQFVPFGASIPSTLAKLGEQLAQLHMMPCGNDRGVGKYGWTSHNFLGGTIQDNTWRTSFRDFCIMNRLLPLYNEASRRFACPAADDGIERFGPRLFERADAILSEVDQTTPSLLHGDLWLGNCGADSDRNPVVYDPACWSGAAEFDLAISTLFGGFGPAFYHAYHHHLPQQPGFHQRQQLYRLYHLLNHLNLYGKGFGSSGTARDPQGYYERAKQLMREIVAGG